MSDIFTDTRDVMETAIPVVPNPADGYAPTNVLRAHVERVCLAGEQLRDETHRLNRAMVGPVDALMRIVNGEKDAPKIAQAALDAMESTDLFIALANRPK